MIIAEAALLSLKSIFDARAEKISSAAIKNRKFSFKSLATYILLAILITAPLIVLRIGTTFSYDLANFEIKLSLKIEIFFEYIEFECYLITYSIV